MAEATLIAQTTATATANHDQQLHQDGETGNGSVKRQKSRHRASVACATCRERRIRCVVPPGEHECLQCQRAGTECVIKNDDERRRPISRAYMSTLTDRVALLESMLKEKGTEPPPVVYPPKTTRGTLNPDGDESPARSHRHQIQVPTNRSVPKSEGPSPASVPEDNYDDSHPGSTTGAESQTRSEKEGSVGTPIDDKKDGLVSRLLSTRGHLSFDQLSGRLRFYGGTVNIHVYSEYAMDDGSTERGSIEQARRAEKCIRSLPLETHDYLMQMFWQHYNSVLHVVHEDAFNEDREHGRKQFYSGFLHVCILAVGFRFADKSRIDIQRLSLPGRENTLHREAKYMLDLELERPGGIPSIAALLILGDQEVSVGRDNVGWMYSGMAMRLCYDLGLQLDSRGAGLSQRELDIRKMTLWACVIYDRYWSLFLGRPLTMKSVDLEIYSLTDQFDRLGTCMPAGPEKSLNTRIYEALIDLMEVAGKIVEHAEFRNQHEQAHGPDQQAYFKMAALDRELHNWASRLPHDLRYNEENRVNAPLAFYLLHQQYHAVLILLHRPFARYDGIDSPEPEEGSALDSHVSQASRSICTKSSIAMARLFWQHRQKFDGKKIFCTGIQHAGAAATALIAALAHMPDAADRSNNMQYLEVLHLALVDMSHAYQPAERMASVLNAVMVELRGGPISPGHVAIPTRRSSTNIEVDRPAVKRRHTDKRSSSQVRPMQPPPQPCRQHRNSDASTAHSYHVLKQIQQQQQQQQQLDPGDFFIVTPQSDAPPWPPNVQAHHNMQQPAMLPTPNTTNVNSPERRQEWINQIGSDFPQIPPMTDIPGLPGGDVSNLEFLHLPSDEDWNRWHAATTSDASTDLDGFPPRARYYHMNDFTSPPIGTVMNGSVPP